MKMNKKLIKEDELKILVGCSVITESEKVVEIIKRYLNNVLESKCLPTPVSLNFNKVPL